MELFYFPDAHTGKTIQADEDNAKHLKAMRLRDGDTVHLTNGKGWLMKGSLRWEGRHAIIAVETGEEYPIGHPQLTLVIAPTKNHDRLEWLVEKSVELGISRIIPVECEHSERPHVRKDRLQRVAVAAMKQSNRYHLPEISDLLSFGDVLKSSDQTAQRCIAHCQSSSFKKRLQDVLIRGENAVLCIGPEGDFSEREISAARDAGFIEISLGNARLRTETAGIAAVHTFELINQ